MTDRTRDQGRLDDVGTEVKGKAQQAVGKLTDDERLEAEGKGNEAKGKLGQAAENVKDVVKDAVDDVKDSGRR